MPLGAHPLTPARPSRTSPPRGRGSLPAGQAPARPQPRSPSALLTGHAVGLRARRFRPRRRRRRLLRAVHGCRCPQPPPPAPHRPQGGSAPRPPRGRGCRLATALTGGPFGQWEAQAGAGAGPGGAGRGSLRDPRSESGS